MGSAEEGGGGGGENEEGRGGQWRRRMVGGGICYIAGLGRFYENHDRAREMSAIITRINAL